MQTIEKIDGQQVVLLLLVLLLILYTIVICYFPPLLASLPFPLRKRENMRDDLLVLSMDPPIRLLSPPFKSFF